MEETEPKKSSLNIPVAIVVAGVLIAGAVFITKTPSAPQANTAAVPSATDNQEIVLRPISASDHILGNPSAKIVIVEYSDLECPFCKVFHATLHQLMEEYGKTGELAWVYRHFPLSELHSKAPKEAEAAECAAEQGGNDAFWKFVDRLFVVTPSNNGLDLAELPRIASFVGLDTAAFSSCLASGKYAEKVQQDYNDAYGAGGRGTPTSIVLSGGQKIPLEGAQPYAAVKALIVNLLSEGTGQGAVPVLEL